MKLFVVPVNEHVLGTPIYRIDDSPCKNLPGQVAKATSRVVFPSMQHEGQETGTHP